MGIKFLKKISLTAVKMSDQKTGLAVLSIFLIIILSTFLLSRNHTGRTYQYRAGDVVMEDIRVSGDIHYLNENETGRLKERTAESVPLVFDRNTKVLDERLNIAGIMFRAVNMTLTQYPVLSESGHDIQLNILKKRLPDYLHLNDSVLLNFLNYQNPAVLQRTVTKILIRIYDNKQQNITAEPYSNPLNIENRHISVRLSGSSSSDEISGSLESLYPLDEVRKNIKSVCREEAPWLSGKTLSAVASFISSILKPDTFFNQEETERRIKGALADVKPVMSMLKKGQTIARQGDTVTLESLEKINVLNRYSEKSNISYAAGIFIIQFVFFVAFFFFILGFKITEIPDRKFSVIIFSLMGIFMLYSYYAASAYSGQGSSISFVFLLPIPLVTMILSVLYSLIFSLLMGLHMIFFTVAIHGCDFSTMVLAVTSALLGVFINWNIQKRTDFLLGGLYIGLINSVAVVAVCLIEEIPAAIMLKNIQMAVMSGLINSIMALGLFPVYETVFGVTTRFKLLELSDLNSPLFRRMLLTAPGTYHHSLIVSNMAEAACRNIKGADPLLARVGAFYHDIGKIEDANMFIENKVTDPRAKTLSPLEYSRLIISHVSKGVDLARKQRLPESIIDFIRQHHGQTVMTFFYFKALESVSAGGKDSVHKTDFQYPGPRPSTRESAVVMMADSIEAASRSLREPTPAKLKGLVQKIIFNKLNDGEFENTELSMSDIKAIEESFLVILNGIYHTRMEYPDSTEVTKLEEKLKQNGKQEN